MLAGISVTLALLMLGVFYVHSGSLRTRGRTLLAIVVYAAATARGVGHLRLHAAVPDDHDRVVVGSLLILGMLGVIAVLFAEAHEWAEAHWIRRPRAAARVRAVRQGAVLTARCRCTCRPTTSRRTC